MKTSGRTIAPSSITSPRLLTAFCTFTNELTSIWRADGSVTMGMSHGNRTTYEMTTRGTRGLFPNGLPASG